MWYVMPYILSAGITRLTCTRLRGDLEYLKTKTRLKDERFESVMGESVI